MPISRKIIAQVNNLNATDDEKKLIMDILQIEDSGSYRFTEEYEALIKDYISSQKSEG